MFFRIRVLPDFFKINEGSPGSFRFGSIFLVIFVFDYFIKILVLDDHTLNPKKPDKCCMFGFGVWRFEVRFQG